MVQASVATGGHPLATPISGGTEVASSATALAAAQCQTSLPATPGVINYLTKFTATAAAVAAVVSGVLTVTGVVGAPLNYQFVETVSAGGALDIWFNPPIPATDVNIAITVTIPAIVGGAATALTVTGWQA